MAVIDVHNVTKSFPLGETRDYLFTDLSFAIEAGQFVALTGPSGCGKSTLLNIIGGLDAPDSGQIVVAGVEVSALSAAARARFLSGTVGFIFQDHHLIPELSAVDNVMLPIRIRGLGRGAARSRANELLSRLGLAKRLGEYPTTLSGGERQRVAVARALANDPSVLLADEPTGSLHPSQKEDVFNDLMRLAKEEQVTVLMVTHDLGLIADDGGLRVDRRIDLEEFEQVQQASGATAAPDVDIRTSAGEKTHDVSAT